MTSLQRVVGSVVRARLSSCGTSLRITSHSVGPCAVRTTIPHARGCGARRDGTHLRGTACFSHGSVRSPSTPDPAAQRRADPRIGLRVGRRVRCKNRYSISRTVSDQSATRALASLARPGVLPSSPAPAAHRYAAAGLDRSTLAERRALRPSTPASALLSVASEPDPTLSVRSNPDLYSWSSGWWPASSSPTARSRSAT
jgi:hypothetical protein